MSRIGKQSINIPQGVTVDLQDRTLSVKGAKGELSFEIGYEVEVKVKEDEIIVKKVGKTKLAPAMWGTTRALIANMVKGVSEGFKRQLELHGVGYKMAVQGNKLVLNLGYSHPIEMEIPKGLTAGIEKETLTIEGVEKQAVGQFASKVRATRKVEPYKGKGFRYVDEQVIRKEGKRAGGAGE